MPGVTASGVCTGVKIKQNLTGNAFLDTGVISFPEMSEV
jgi:hypothetical protein